MANLFESMFGDWMGKKKLSVDNTDDIRGNQIATDFTDGALDIQDSVNSYILNFDWTANNQASMIDTYRQTSEYNEVAFAIDDIVNEMVSFAEDEAPIQLDLTDVEELSDAIKKKIYDRWDHLTKVMNLKDSVHTKVRNFYIDGRLAYQKVIDKNSPKKGILNIVELDTRNVTKVRNTLYDPETMTISGIEEFFVYDESKSKYDYSGAKTQNGSTMSGGAPNPKYKEALKLNKESLAYVTSGMVDSNTGWAISWLHKAVKPANQLNMMENALVIYRISRAPERRVFYVDVGNMPKSKAEQYLHNLKNSYRNKMSYDPENGTFKDQRHLQTMQEDFWLPRNSSGKGTEVSTLAGGSNLGDIEDVQYFLRRLYKALNIPLSRLEQDSISVIGGRSTEINRDELKFSKFISRIRKRFNIVLLDILRTDLVLTNILTAAEFQEIEDKIKFKYAQDMYLEERKFFEMTRDRLELAGEMMQYVGRFYSNEYVRTHILHQSDEEIEEIDKQIEDEKDNPQYPTMVAQDQLDPSLDPAFGGAEMSDTPIGASPDGSDDGSDDTTQN